MTHHNNDDKFKKELHQKIRHRTIINLLTYILCAFAAMVGLLMAAGIVKIIIKNPSLLLMFIGLLLAIYIVYQRSKKEILTEANIMNLAEEKKNDKKQNEKQAESNKKNTIQTGDKSNER